MKGEVERHDRAQEPAQGRENALHAPEAESSHEQPELLSALPLHLPTQNLLSDAEITICKYKLLIINVNAFVLG